MEITIESGWQLRQEPLDAGAGMWPIVAERSDGWMDCSLPCDVLMPLIAEGKVAEPLEKLNSLECRWIEERSWWFRTSFELPRDFGQHERCELVLEMLDVEADIFVNSVHAGHQRSAFYPFRADVKALLRPGKNLLGVRVTTGVERVSDADLAGFKENVSTEAAAGRGTRGDRRRALLRKPQYVFGWDWGPRLATAGIMGTVKLDLVGPVRFGALHAATQSLSADRALLSVSVEVENTHLFSTRECTLSIRLERNGELAAEASTDALLRSGVNYVDLPLTVDSPELWWPNGYGDQPLYALSADATVDGVQISLPPIEIGIRTVELDQTPELGGRRFSLRVNDVRIFSKGGNWVPADSIYARVTPEKYERLVGEAREANFTMLRIWGGGRYEAESFYDACDRAGIVVWHDFMFACSVYPDNQSWFVDEVRREADYQTRRLRNHPCMGLFSGSNENNWFFDEWWDDEAGPKPSFPGGARIYNTILPETVRRNCPAIPYWNGSPYGGEHPNGNDAGDRHEWKEAMMSPTMERRITPEHYDDLQARFVSEYGYVGPCRRSSIERYHAGEAIDRGGPIWRHHTNEFEKDTVVAGIRKHYVDPESLSLDEYLLYSSLVQGLMYGYSLDAMRINERNSGALFWMYDDCWGEVGWTIIDYYLARKPAYYWVRRAFAPRKLVVRAADGDVVVHGLNERSAAVHATLEIGTVDLDGGCTVRQSLSVEIPPRFRGIIGRTKKLTTDPARVLWYARIEGDAGFAPATLRELEYRKLALAKPTLSIEGMRRQGHGLSFTVRSDLFAHAVHFGLPDAVRPSDEYFDLLPGEERTIVLEGEALSLPREVRALSVVPAGG